MKRLIAAALLVLMAALPACGLCGALAEAAEGPEAYIGTWVGGEDYGETREYYLELTDFKDGVFTAVLDIYRIRGFDGMTALLTEEGTSAVLSTGTFDEFSLLGTLDLAAEGIKMTILESDCPDLPAETMVQFERAE